MHAELIVAFRSYRRTLTALRELWEAGQARRHAETTGFVLGQMMLHPRTVGDKLLPAITDFVAAHGPHGVDSVFLSAISAASIYNGENFQAALDVAHAAGGKLRAEGKPGFLIDFTDLAVEATQIVGDLLGAVRGRSHPAYSMPGMQQVANRIHRARQGLRTPGFEHTFFAEIISKLYPDGIRNALYLNLPKPSRFGALPGFGLQLRQAMSPFDEYRYPGASAAQSDNAGAEKEAAVAAMFTGMAGAASGRPEAMPGAHPGLPSHDVLSLFLAIASAFAGTGARASSVPAEEPPPWEPAGVCVDPDAEVKIPVPDAAVGSRRPSLWELFGAARRYARRLDPWLRPSQEDLGGGVTLFRIPDPGVVDPLWADTDFTLPEEELRRWLEFLHAKYFDSLVNPVR